LIVVPVAIFFLAGLPCCGDEAPSDKADGENITELQHEAGKSDGHEGHQHDVTDKRPKLPEKIPAPVMDSLRVKKKRYNITLDTYWEDKGGILANDFVEVYYPAGQMMVTHAMYALEQIVFARDKCRTYWGSMPNHKLKLICTAEMEDFKEVTRLDWWRYSKIEGDQITFQPIYILFQRQLGEVAIAHEYHEWAIGRLAAGKAPRLLVEGLASHLSGEAKILAKQLSVIPEEDRNMSPDEVEKTLLKESRKDRSRVAYYHAHRLVVGIIFQHGQESLQLVIKRLGEGVELDEAFREACNKSYEAVLLEVKDYKGNSGS
ncbi:MAG: hypothetical protein ABIA59_02800, partial [Candidatus Latescibacterota bacterium]